MVYNHVRKSVSRDPFLAKCPGTSPAWRFVLPDCHLMPETVADLGGDLDDFGAVGHGVHQLEAPLVQFQRDVLLTRVARVDAQDYPLKKDGRLNMRCYEPWACIGHLKWPSERVDSFGNLCSLFVFEGRRNNMKHDVTFGMPLLNVARYLLFVHVSLTKCYSSGYLRLTMHQGHLSGA